MTQTLRMLLDGEDVLVHAVLTGPTDTDKVLRLATSVG